jgi:hypothetical protein
MLLTMILIINLIVGQLSSAYKKYIKNRNVLMLLETLSVREASEADDKYSASVSCPYPFSIANLLFGTYILSVKNEAHNIIILHLYFLPTMVTSLIIFSVYQVLILPISYAKTVGHKFALMVKNPTGKGSKTASNRLGYAVFFLAFGLPILAANSVVDIYWFLIHLYKMDLDTLQKIKVQESKYGNKQGVNSKTFKKMLKYFELQSSREQKQITLQKDVSMDIRNYLDVDKGLRALVFGYDKTDYTKLDSSAV